jgi:hypothetical protein
MIRVVHPESRIRKLTFSHPGSRIPDPGVKKHPIPDPGSRIRIRNTVLDDGGIRSRLTTCDYRIRMRIREAQKLTDPTYRSGSTTLQNTTRTVCKRTLSRSASTSISMSVSSRELSSVLEAAAIRSRSSASSSNEEAAAAAITSSTSNRDKDDNHRQNNLDWKFLKF